MSSAGRCASLAALRVVMVTDGKGDAERIVGLATAAVSAGLRAVQLREPHLGARDLTALCARLHPLLRDVAGVLLVNDRVDVAATAACDGVHLAQRSLAPAAARRLLGARACIGVSTHDEAELAQAREGGADYASLSPVFATGCKPGNPGIGVGRARLWTARAGMPVVWLGGIDVESARGLDPTPGLLGLAVRGALSDPTTIAGYVRRLLVEAARVAEVDS